MKDAQKWTKLFTFDFDEIFFMFTFKGGSIDSVIIECVRSWKSEWHSIWHQQQLANLMWTYWIYEERKAAKRNTDLNDSPLGEEEMKFSLIHRKFLAFVYQHDI